MALIIATGSNLGDKVANLRTAAAELNFLFPGRIEKSSIYSSPAVDYLSQPDFYNQVLQFPLPKCSPQKAMEEILQLEKKMGRTRDIPKGPRLIDIDIIFWGLEKIQLNNLEIPHPRWNERSFVVLPFQELTYAKVIASKFTIPKNFNNTASPI